MSALKLKKSAQSVESRKILLKGKELMWYIISPFVGSCLITNVFIGNFLAMGRGRVIISRPAMNGGQLPKISYITLIIIGVHSTIL